MQEKSKGQTFIGFALRSGKYKAGGNAIKTLKRANLIVVCRTAGENTLKDGEKLSKKFHCPLLVTKDKTLEEYTYKPNKIMAVTDKALSKAILVEAGEEFILKQSGDYNG